MKRHNSGLGHKLGQILFSPLGLLAFHLGVWMRSCFKQGREREDGSSAALSRDCIYPDCLGHCCPAHYGFCCARPEHRGYNRDAARQLDVNGEGAVDVSMVTSEEEWKLEDLRARRAPRRKLEAAERESRDLGARRFPRRNVQAVER